MSSVDKEVKVIFIITMRLYLETFREAAQGFVTNWFVPLVHIGYLFLLGICVTIAQMFGGGLIGSLILGMVLCVFLASYFSTVLAGIENNRVNVKELWQDMGELFSPMISVLFALFIFKLVVGFGAGPSTPQWIHATIGLFLAVLLNPLPEVITYNQGTALYSFQVCFEFIKENFIEWFVPFLFFLLPLYFIYPDSFLDVTIYFMTKNPLFIVESFLMAFGGSIAFSSFGLVTLPVLFIMYFIFIFRGVLYKKLATSTRRKRKYQYQYES